MWLDSPGNYNISPMLFGGQNFFASPPSFTGLNSVDLFNPFNSFNSFNSFSSFNSFTPSFGSSFSMGNLPMTGFSTSNSFIPLMPMGNWGRPLNRSRSVFSNNNYRKPANEPVGHANELIIKKRLSATCRKNMQQIAKEINCNPEDIERLIYIESRNNHKARNKSGATGLMQFMPSTTKELGTSTSAIYNMTAEQQMYYVRKFLINAKKIAGYSKDYKLSAGELYGLVLMPGYIKKDKGYWKGDSRYDQNSRALDVNNNGVINRYDLEQKMASVKILNNSG